MALAYRFGEFKLVPATRELWRGDAPVAVPPRAFDCIVYLLERRERAVGRDELIAAVWGRTETGDGTLGQTVLAARRALDDTGKEQHVIRTVFRFGYHWVAPVETIDDAGSEVLPADTTPAAEDRRDEAHSAAPPGETESASRRTVRWPLLAVALALAALSAGALIWLRHTHRAVPAAPTDAGPRGTAVVLVLPVAVSAGNGYDWVRLGLMDLIGARLRTAGLPVVPSDNVVALTGARAADGSAAGLARAAGATLVVEPRAEALDGRWRVTLRTTYGREPAVTATGESADVLAAARTAADALARALGYAPDNASSAADGDPLALANLSQQIEAAVLADRIDAARALIASATPAQREQPELRLRAAQIAYQAGDFDAAEAGFDAVAKAASAEQDPVLHARSIMNLGVIAAIRDDPDLAQRRFDEAIELLRSQHAPDALGKALNARANINGLESRYDAALRDFAEARAAFESSGNLLALAVLDSNLAAMDMHRYRYAEAEPVFRRAAERFATFGVNAAELNALAGVVELKLALLEPDAALAMEPRLRELIGKVADPARKRGGELTRVEALAAVGRLREAATALAKTESEAEQADDRAAIVHAHMIAARLADARGDPHSAAVEAEAAMKRATVADDARERARTSRLLVRSLLATGDVEAAKAAASQLGAFAKADGTAPTQLHARLAEADCAAATGNASAGPAYREALNDADTLRIPEDIRDAAGAYAVWLIGNGDLAGAGAAAERVAGWSARDYASALVQLRVQRALGDQTLWRGALARALALGGERRIPADLADARPAP